MALRAIVYLFPLASTNTALRAAAYLRRLPFPWYDTSILLAVAIALFLVRAYPFTQQQD